MSLAIIDNHSGIHGDLVSKAAKQRYDGTIEKFDFDENFVTFKDINDQIRSVLEANRDGANISVVNLSFGSGNTDDPTFFIDSDNSFRQNYHELQQDLFQSGILMTVAAGNDGDWHDQNGVNILSSSSYNLSVGALTNSKSSEFADYSQWDSANNEIFASGKLEVEEDTFFGTSFAAPRVGGTIADLRDNGLSLPESLTKLESTSLLMDKDTEHDTFTFSQLDDIDNYEPVEIDQDQIVDAAIEVFHGRNPNIGEVNDLIKKGFDQEPILYFDSAYYLEQNPDVAEALYEDNWLNSAWQHWKDFGHTEERDPNSYFDTSDYLEQNPRVAEVTQQDKLFDTAFEHFRKYGFNEGREANPIWQTEEIVEQIALNAENLDKIPVIERVQALSHLGKHSESSLFEMGRYIDKAIQPGTSWQELTQSYVLENDLENNLEHKFAFEQFLDLSETPVGEDNRPVDSAAANSLSNEAIGIDDKEIDLVGQPDNDTDVFGTEA